MTGGGGEDSGSVAAGSVAAGNVALGSFATVASLGAVKIGGNLQGGGGLRSGYLSAVQNIGAISIAGSLVGGSGERSGTIEIGEVSDTKQTIRAITIGGDVIGGGGYFSGALTAYILTDADDFVGPVKVAGDWKGGSGNSSGSIRIGNVASITLGGSLIGGSAGGITGYWRMIGATIKIGGDVVGGSVADSGAISVNFSKSITIAGSVIGGTASGTGLVEGAVQSLVIGHDIHGGDAGATSLDGTGYLNLSGAGSVIIGGSVIAGRETGAGELSQSGAIYSSGAIGSLTVKGSLVGNADAQVAIIVRGTNSGADTDVPDLVLKKLTVTGRVEHALIAAGLDSGQNGNNPDAQIGSVTVGGNWIASDLIAGLDRTDGRTGDGNDQKIPVLNFDSPHQFSKIASITIGGHVLGDSSDLTRTFGFGAEEIGSFKVNGIALPLTALKDNFTGSGVAGNAIAVGPGRVTSTVDDHFAVHVFEI